MGNRGMDSTDLVGLRGYPACDGVFLWDDIYSVLGEFLTVDFDECKDVVELQHGETQGLGSLRGGCTPEGLSHDHVTLTCAGT